MLKIYSISFCIYIDYGYFIKMRGEGFKKVTDKLENLSLVVNLLYLRYIKILGEQSNLIDEGVNLQPYMFMCENIFVIDEILLW